MSIKELFEYYFSINLSDYSSIGIDLPINLLLLAFLIGMLLTIIIINLIRETNTQITKKLLRYEAISEETSKTLDELKINNYLTRLTLINNERMRKIVKRVGETEYTFEEYNEAIKSKNFKEEKIDFSSSKFYISKDCLEEATKISEMKNSSVLNTVLLCILITIAVSCIIICMPEILTIIDSALTK